MPSRVGERGQITVEKAIREELAVYAGDQAIRVGSRIDGSSWSSCRPRIGVRLQAAWPAR